MSRTYHQRGVPVDGFACRDHPLYMTWACMLSRCYNPLATSYSNYGGRGVIVAERWHDFKYFASDMGLKPDPKLTLERRDNLGNYTLENCTWATRTDQCLNRRIFTSNTTGFTGVISVKDRFEARFDFEHARYRIGRFKTAELASAAREVFIDLFSVDKFAAVKTISHETVRHTSLTGVRGVTPHKDGGYIARVTQNGVRKYLGYFPTMNLAEDAVKGAI